jgi:pilus assembly protein CpaE
VSLARNQPNWGPAEGLSDRAGGGEAADIRRLRIAAQTDQANGPAPRVAAVPEVLPQQVVVVCGPKGGVGKTFIACNLAAALAERSKLKVGLIDLDVAGGDAGLFLDLLDGPGLQELMPVLKDGLTQETLLGAMVIHRPTGARVLLSPARPELSEAFGPRELQALLTAARKDFQILILDTPGGADNDLLYEAIEGASLIVLVTSPDATSLRRCRVLIDLLKRLNVPLDERLKVVMNRADPAGRITPAGAQAFLGVRLLAVVAEDRKVVDASLFEGIPAVLTHRQHPVSLSLMKVANEVCPIFAETARPNRLALALPGRRRGP